MKNELPKHLQDKVAAMPEYSYGVNRVVVTLDDGTKVRDVFIGWAQEVVKVGTSEDLPFDAARIVDVEKQ